jgi:hypothetical protein
VRGWMTGRARAALPASAVRVRAADVPWRVAGDAGGAGRASRHGAVLRVAACQRRPRGHGGRARAHVAQEAPARLHRRTEDPPAARPRRR